MDERETVAQNVVALMQQAGIKSQSELARITGISQTQIGNILHQNTSISIDLLGRLAIGLKCKTWLLLSPLGFLDNGPDTDVAPLVHCYLGLCPDDQNIVWKITHQLYAASKLHILAQSEH